MESRRSKIKSKQQTYKRGPINLYKLKSFQAELRSRLVHDERDVEQRGF